MLIGMRIFQDQRGVSAIGGLMLVVTIALSVGVSAYIANWVPNEQELREYDAMREIEQSFRELKRAIEGLESGEEATVRVKLGAEPVSWYAYHRGHAELEAHPPRYVDWLSPVADTYVREDQTDASFGGDNVLWVSPTAPAGGPAGAPSNVIVNGSFATDNASWGFRVVGGNTDKAGGPTASYQATLGSPPGSERISSGTITSKGADRTGTGEIYRSFTIGNNNPSLVRLSYKWSSRGSRIFTCTPKIDSASRENLSSSTGSAL